MDRVTAVDVGVFRGGGSSHARAMGLIVVLVRHLLPPRVLDLNLNRLFLDLFLCFAGN